MQEHLEFIDKSDRLYKRKHQVTLHSSPINEIGSSNPVFAGLSTRDLASKETNQLK